ARSLMDLGLSWLWASGNARQQLQSGSGRAGGVEGARARARGCVGCSYSASLRARGRACRARGAGCWIAGLKAAERRGVMIGKRRWARVAAMIAGLCAGVLGSVAVGQDRGATPPKETIFARKILMDTIGRNMDDLEANAGSAKVDLTEGRDHADVISVMLMAF